MKDQKFREIFKTKKEAPAIPDLSAYADDILGPDMCGQPSDVPEEIRMIQRKRAIRPFIDPLPADEPNEEENEEGELDSGPEAPRLSNHEQKIQHGFNPDAEQKANKWEQFKKVDVLTIPRLISAGVETRSHVVPSYNQVKDLPDEIRSPVVALEKQLFKMVTNTPAKDIQVLAHIEGKGPNSADELEAVQSWIKHTGHNDDELIQDLEDRIHGLQMFHTEGITHLLVNNSAGKFIFSWPSTDNHISKRAI